MKSLVAKKYTIDDRKYMVRVLATMILTHIENASMEDCAEVSKALVLKYPFLGDYVCDLCNTLVRGLISPLHNIFTTKTTTPLITILRLVITLAWLLTHAMKYCAHR